MVASLEQVRSAFERLVGDTNFPCLAAKGVVHGGGHDLHLYDDLGTQTAAHALAIDLASFVSREAAAGHRFKAFVAIFNGPRVRDELDFERKLWHQLQLLHDCDDVTAGWDPAVSDDPADPRFSFSFAGKGLFVVGLHPQSSRISRRFDWPALVFNPHAQFDQLRRDGHFERMRDRIRQRDVALQGTVNPNLANFGERSEAEQYSGRDLSSEQWRCPFHRRAS